MKEIAALLTLAVAACSGTARLPVAEEQGRATPAGTDRRSSACQLKPADFRLFASAPYSLDGKPTSMNAQFTPTDVDGDPVGLTHAARACGYDHFNWQQQITALPTPNAFQAANPFPPYLKPANVRPDGLTAPPDFYDPPPGGYALPQSVPDDYPYFYGGTELVEGVRACIRGAFISVVTSDTLTYQDCPGDTQLPDGRAMEFKTWLVGVTAGPPVALSIQPGVPTTEPLFVWTWQSTYRGGPAPAPRSASRNRTGGVVITSINGSVQTPPRVACQTSPGMFLWPPTRRAVVNVSGSVTPGTSPIASGQITYAVSDGRGRAQASGPVVVKADGTFALEVPLASSRPENVRRYTITVTAPDEIGNQGSCWTRAAVPGELVR